MYSTTDFRRGLKIELDGTPYEIVEFQHFKPGKGGAMVRTKLRNILNGRTVDNTFRSGEKVGKPDMEQRDMQFLYHEGKDLVFMDMVTYEQLHLAEEFTGGKSAFLKDAQECRVLLYNGEPIDIEIPVSLVLEVTKTEPGAKGDTVSNVTKPAVLETGRHRPGAAVYQRRRQNQGGHPHPRISGPRINVVLPVFGRGRSVRPAPSGINRGVCRQPVSTHARFGLCRRESRPRGGRRVSAPSGASSPGIRSDGARSLSRTDRN